MKKTQHTPPEDTFLGTNKGRSGHLEPLRPLCYCKDNTSAGEMQMKCCEDLKT